MSTSSASSPQTQPPHMGKIVLGPGLTGTLYVLLLVSAATALWVRRSPGQVPLGLQLAAPWLFFAFLVGFAVYRFGTVRAHKYPVAKAFFQIAVAALFFMLLLPSPQKQALTAQDSVLLLLRDSNPHARAMAAEVARYRPDGKRYVSALTKALRDPNPDVKTQAHQSLVLLTGADLGAPTEPEAVKRWMETYP